MTVYWILLIITAFFAYCMGSLSTISIASVIIYKKNLRRLGSSNVWLSNFRRIYGWKGFVTLLLTELIKNLLPILLGGLLLGFKDQALVGRAFAGFCIVLGRLWPVFNRFRGSYGIGALIVAAMGVKVSLGIVALVVYAGFLLYKRSMSLACLLSAVSFLLLSAVLIDENIVMLLCIFISLMVIIRLVPKLMLFFKGLEPKLSFKEDISWKFDQKF